MSIISRWRRAAIFYLICVILDTWVILDYARRVIVGLSLIVKCGFDPIYSFGDMTIFIFRRFGLPNPTHFGGIWGHIPPKYGVFLEPVSRAGFWLVSPDTSALTTAHSCCTPTQYSIHSGSDSVPSWRPESRQSPLAW